MKIAVISGKGGSGKSSVTAALLAMSKHVMAVDCDVDASNLPLLFPNTPLNHETFASGEEVEVNVEACVGCGICVQNCAFGALVLTMNGHVRPREFMCEGCGLCVKLCPHRALHMVLEERSDIYTSKLDNGLMVHGRLCPGDDNSGKMIARMRAIADNLMVEQKMDLQILDGPPGIGCPVLSTVTGMDKVVIVAEPTLSGISDLERAYKVASSFCTEIIVVINKFDINKENCTVIRNFCKQCNMEIVAELPFNRMMVEAQLHCQSIVTYAPESECAQVLKSAYQRIV